MRTLQDIKDDAEALIRHAGRDRAPVDAGSVFKLLRLIEEADSHGYAECVKELDEQGMLY